LGTLWNQASLLFLENALSTRKGEGRCELASRVCDRVSLAA
jgi:hypothetical protein